MPRSCGLGRQGEHLGPHWKSGMVCLPEVMTTPYSTPATGRPRFVASCGETSNQLTCFCPAARVQTMKLGASLAEADSGPAGGLQAVSMASADNMIQELRM